MKRNILIPVILGLAMAGCTMMPNYERPAAPVSDSWHASPGSTNTTANAADTDWREFFDDPRLQQLITVALQNNRDLRIAALRVEQFRAQYRIQRAALSPGVQGEAGMTRQKFSGAVTTFGGGTIMTTYNLDLGAAYELDLFGRIRSLKREALERYLATEEARRSVQIALISEVATEYLNQLRLQAAEVVVSQTVEAVQTSYNLIKRSFEAGVASELDVRTAESQVQTARINAADIQQSLAQSRNALVELIGQPLPMDLPTGKPLHEQRLLALAPSEIASEALQRRPDILAAEHVLKASNANIGAARAAFFPRIVLTGSAGTASAKLTDLFTGPSGTWSFSPQITIPIFEYGATAARLDVSKISKRIEIANYEKAIQVAFREVADALAVRSILEVKVQAQEQLLAAQSKRFELTTARYKQGVDNYVDVLLAQQDLYAAQQTLLQVQAVRLLNAVALYRSLGGGWSPQDHQPPQ